MNRKFLLLTTLILQSYAHLHGLNGIQANWDAAFAAFGGASGIEGNKGKLSYGNAYSVASGLKTQEGMAVGRYLNGMASKAALFKSSFTDADVEAALDITPPAGTTPTGDTVNANWDAAIAAFGTAQNVFDKVTTITRSIPTSVATTAAHYKDAQVVLQWLQGATLNTTDAAQLDAAFTRANVNRASSATTAKDTAAAQLKAEIEAAKLVYNQYKPGTYTPTA